MTRRAWIISGVVVALAVVGGLLRRQRGPAAATVDTGRVSRQATFRATVTASGEIVAARYADIGSNSMGKIVELPVAEGDHVRAGQVLARIDPVPADSDARSAAELTRALEADERAATEQVRAARADADAAEARAADAAQQFTRRTALADQQLIAPAELDEARAQRDSTAAQAASARASVARTTQALDAAGRRVAQARAQQRRAGDALAKTAIVSPIDGTVSRLRVRNGEMVVVGLQNQPGTTLMTISDLGTIDVEVKVAEADVLTVSPGQSAEVTLESIPGRVFRGRVHEVGASALPVTGTAAAREFRVVIRLEAPDAGLRPGLTGDAVIVTTERSNVLSVPLQSVVRRDGVNGVFRIDGGVARFTPVTTGVIGGLDIEVTGIPEGTVVATGPYQVLRELKDGAAATAAATK